MIASSTARKRTRNFSLAAVMIAAALGSGCDNNYTENMRYPERTDVLIGSPFKSSPARFDPPGLFPNQLSTLVADDAELKEKVFDPSRLDPNFRSALNDNLLKYFGTPLHPTVGGLDESTRSQLQLDDATLAEGAKAYRLHCLHCHGLTGNGRGPTAPWVNPHPRDYRQGIFKFISSSSGKPRREDLLRTLRVGIEGTSMPSFGLHSETELNQLVSYVIHLSLRGQVEYQMIRDAVQNPKGDAAKVSDVETMVKDWIYSPDQISFAGSWRDAEAKLVVPDPAAFPKDLAASVERGYSLFQAKEFMDRDASNQPVKRSGQGCISCHIDFGRTENLKYDDWGTIVRPADLTRSVYRGGQRPIDLYWRVHLGIPGANMAGSSSGLNSRDIWDVVNFLQVLPYVKHPDMRKKYPLPGLVIDER